MQAAGGFAFGPYQLDIQSRRLLRNDSLVALPDRQFDLLTALVTRAGKLLTKDDLMTAAWGDVVVAENTLVVAISRLRGTLDTPDFTRHVETASGFGYRFVAPVTPITVARTDADLDALLAPRRAFVDGRALLETLQRDEILRAKALFEGLLVRHGDHPAVHVGFATACLLLYESTRADAAPDREALQLSVNHGRDACRLKPRYAEAWATLGIALERTGDHVGAIAALQFAVELEDERWTHHLRLAFIAWGAERLLAAMRTLALMPECPLARVLVASVLIARGRLAEAEQQIDLGIAEFRAQTPASRFSVVALFWLKGLLCLQRGAINEALAAFEQELALEGRGHLYARECCANTWYAIGACHFLRGDLVAARAAFEQAIARIALHPGALAGLALLATDRPQVTIPAAMLAIPEVAIARAVMFVNDGDTPGAVTIVETMLASAPEGNAGWLVPIEPMLGVHRDRAAWASVLTKLRERAV